MSYWVPYELPKKKNYFVVYIFMNISFVRFEITLVS